MTRFYHKLLLLFAGMSLAASPGAFADGVTVGHFNFVLNKTAKTATLTYQSISSNTPNYPELSGEVVVPATVTSDGVDYTVTGIKYRAFYNCQNITKITLPPYQRPSPITPTPVGSSTAVPPSKRLSLTPPEHSRLSRRTRLQGLRH